MMSEFHNPHRGHPSPDSPSYDSGSPLSNSWGPRTSARDIWEAYDHGHTIEEDRVVLNDISSRDKIVTVLAERHQDVPGVLNRLALLKGTAALLDLDDMNMRGDQVWIAYREVCGGNFEDFANRVVERDQALLDGVNRLARERGIPHVAVRHSGPLRHRVGS